MKKYICLDIGGTMIKYGVIDESECFVTVGERPTEAWKGGKSIEEKVLAIAGRLREKYGAEGVCISTAGMVDPDNGEIFYASDLIPGYMGINLKKSVEKNMKIPCEVENDVNCAGLAEAVSGAGKDRNLIVCLTVGTGIGGAFIQNGKIYRGGSGSAGEAGYMWTARGIFQDQGSARTLSEKVSEEKKDGEWDGKKIFDAAENGDRICIDAIDGMCDVLGSGIANICYILNPEMVVLGGGITARRDMLEARINRAVRRYLLPVIADNTEICFAQHGNNAGMLGAYYNFRNRQ